MDIHYACADMPADMIDCSVARGAVGIVIAGDGNGNMNAATVERAAQAAAQGIIIVRSSRVPSGKVGRNVEIDDDRLKFIVSDELNPAKARILLMLALLKNVPRKRWPWVIFRENLIALTVLVAFLFGGRCLLEVLSIREAELGIAGGVVILTIREKLPNEIAGSFLPFLAGAAAYTALLLLIERMAKAVPQ